MIKNMSPQTFEYTYNEISKKERIDLFDVISILLSRKYKIESVLDEFHESLNPSDISNSLYVWIPHGNNKRKILPRGELGNTFGVNFEDHHNTYYDLHLRSSLRISKTSSIVSGLNEKNQDGSLVSPIIYTIGLYVKPRTNAKLFLREFSTFMDKDTVPWNNYQLNKTLDSSTKILLDQLKKEKELQPAINTDITYLWNRYKDPILEKKEITENKNKINVSIIEKPNHLDHEGIWFLTKYIGTPKIGLDNPGKIDDNQSNYRLEKLKTVFKLQVFVSPKTYHLHYDKKQADSITLGNLFTQFATGLPDKPTDKTNNFSEYDWVHYDSRFTLHNILHMINRFQTDIVLPVNIDFYSSLFVLFREYLKKNGTSNGNDSVATQASIVFIKKNWSRFKKTLLDKYYGKDELHFNMMLFDEELMRRKRRPSSKPIHSNPILDIYNQFIKWRDTGKIGKLFTLFMLNRFFSLNHFRRASFEDGKHQTLTNGTYILRWRNDESLDRTLNFQHNSSYNKPKIIIVPSETKLSNGEQFVKLEIDELMPVMVFYVSVVDKIQSIKIEVKKNEMKETKIPIILHDKTGLESNFSLRHALQPEFIYVRISNGPFLSVNRVNHNNNNPNETLIEVKSRSIRIDLPLTLTIECNDELAIDNSFKNKSVVLADESKCTFTLFNGTNKLGSVQRIRTWTNDTLRLHVYQRIPSSRFNDAGKFYGYHIHPLQEMNIHFNHHVLDKQNISVMNVNSNKWTTNVIRKSLKNDFSMIKGIKISSTTNDRSLVPSTNNKMNTYLTDDDLVVVPLITQKDTNSGNYIFYDQIGLNFVTMTIKIDPVDMRTEKRFSVKSKRKLGESEWNFTLYPHVENSPTLKLIGYNHDYIRFHQRTHDIYNSQAWIGTFNRTTLLPDYYDLSPNYIKNGLALSPTMINQRIVENSSYFTNVPTVNEWDMNKFMDIIQIGSCKKELSIRCKDLHETIVREKKRIALILNKIASRTWKYSENFYYKTIEQLKELLKLQSNFNRLQGFNQDYVNAFGYNSKNILMNPEGLFILTEFDLTILAHKIMPINPLYFNIKNEDGEEEVFEIPIRLLKNSENSIINKTLEQIRKIIEKQSVDTLNINAYKKLLFNLDIDGLIIATNITDNIEDKNKALDTLNLNKDMMNSLSSLPELDVLDDNIESETDKLVENLTIEINNLSKEVEDIKSGIKERKKLFDDDEKKFIEEIKKEKDKDKKKEIQNRFKEISDAFEKNRRRPERKLKTKEKRSAQKNDELNKMIELNRTSKKKVIKL